MNLNKEVVNPVKDAKACLFEVYKKMRIPKKQTLLPCLVASAIASICAQAQDWDGSAGSSGYLNSLQDVSGSNVGPSGALVKSIPLASGVSATYNSSSGEWSVGGFSAISRSAKWGVPKFTNDDVFELDGNELIEVARDSQKIEYIASKNSYAKFTYYYPNTPNSYWKVEHKDGSVSFYGADASGSIADDARFESLGQPVGIEPERQPLRWALKYSLDSTQHNFTAFNYAEATSGERWQVLKSIVSGKVNAANYACSVLAHEMQPHPRSNYSRGAQDLNLFRVVAVKQTLECDLNGQHGTIVNGVKLGWDTRPLTQKNVLSFTQEYGNDLVADYASHGGQSVFTDIVSGSTLPKTQFHYAQGTLSSDTASDWQLNEYANDDNSKGWLRYSESQVVSRNQQNQITNTYHLTKRNFIDMNGDGLLDRVIHPGGHFSEGGEFKVALNNGTSFGNFQTWPILHGAYTVTNNSAGHADLMDMNGDGLPDMVTQLTNSSPDWNGQLLVQFNTGAGFAAEQNWGTPGHNSLHYLRLNMTYREHARDISAMRYDYIDMNGDGLPDRVERMTASGSGADAQVTHFNVWLNKGAGNFASSAEQWRIHGDTANVLYEFNASFRHNEQSSGGTFAYDMVSATQLKDMNGDGLVDFIYQNSDPNFPEHSGHLWVALNTGHFFAAPVNWGKPGDVGYLRSARHSNNAAPKNQNAMYDYMDMNADGLPDRVLVDSNNRINVYYNSGSGFSDSAAILQNLAVESLRYNVSRELEQANGDPDDSWDGQGNDLLDLNGDGLLDWVYYNAEHNNTDLQVRLTNAASPDDSLLTGIQHSTGGTVNFEYQPMQRSENPNYKRRKWVLSKVTSDNGINTPSSVEYRYSKAKYDAEQRLDYGFRNISQIYPTGDRLESIYYQDTCFAGNVRNTILRDNQEQVQQISNTILFNLSLRNADAYRGASHIAK